MKNKFGLHRITIETRQHEHLIGALPPQAVAEVRDILLAPLGATPYSTLKEALIARLVAREQRRLRQLLSEEELGDHRPTQFLKHPQQLLGDKAATLDTAILRKFFLQRFPVHVRLGLTAAHRLGLPEIAELADRMMEIAGPPANAVHPAESAAAAIASFELASLRSTVQDLAAQVAELRQELRARPSRAVYRPTYRSAS